MYMFKLSIEHRIVSHLFAFNTRTRHRKKMADCSSSQLFPRRIFLRYRTDDAPSDLQIIQDFYAFSGLSDDICFIHWQKNRDTYVVLDVHHGTSFDQQCVQDLPHQIYQLSWKPDSETMSVSIQKSSIGKSKI